MKLRTRFVAGLIVIALTVCGAGKSRADIVVDFDDHSLPPNSYYNGADQARGFTSRGAFFNNSYNASFAYWQGWSYSNRSDTTTPGYDNQYSAWTGSGAGGTGNYGIAFCPFPGDAYIDLPGAPKSLLVTNTTYAALSMRDGDPFTNGPFGGMDGNRPDWFRLTITGYDAIGGANGLGAAVGSVQVYLADYRFLDNTLDYILSAWTSIDLSSLANAQSLSFGLTSSDNGTFGMNTPAFFALDNLVTIPEPSSMVLATVASALAGCGFGLRRKFDNSKCKAE